MNYMFLFIPIEQKYQIKDYNINLFWGRLADLKYEVYPCFCLLLLHEVFQFIPVTLAGSI